MTQTVTFDAAPQLQIYIYTDILNDHCVKVSFKCHRMMMVPVWSVSKNRPLMGNVSPKYGVLNHTATMK